MFSSRVPSTLRPNRLTAMRARLDAAGVDLVDLTDTNPTRADLFGDERWPALLDRPAVTLYRPDPLGLESARRAVSADLATRGLDVPWTRVVLTSSTSEAYSHLFKLTCDQGSEALVPHPSYPLFDHLTRLDLVTAVPYQVQYDGAWAIDLGGLERACTDRTRLVLVVSPNNPTGSCLTAAEREAIVALCRRRDLLLVVDEVFADYPLDPRDDVAGSMCGEARCLTAVLGGLSKSAGLPQAKLAWFVVSGPPDLARDALARLEVVADAYLSVGSAVQEAAGDLLAAGRARREAIAARVGRNYASLASLVGSVPECRVLRADGGWSAVMRVPSIVDDETLAGMLLEEDHVIVHPGYFFDFGRDGFVPVSLLPPPPRFDEGVSRVLGRMRTLLAQGPA